MKPGRKRAEEINVVIAFYDRGFDYRKLQIAFDAIRFHGRATLVTTNPDRYCPLPGGRGELDAAAIEGYTGAKCEVNVGKPDPIMLDAVMDGLGLETRDCIMTGDRLYTDIRMALDAGMPSAVVLTGEAKAQDLQDGPEDVPKYVLERKDHPIPTSLRAELGWKDD